MRRTCCDVQAAARVRTLEAEVESLKKKAGGLAKERLLKEKEMKKLQANKDKKVGCWPWHVRVVQGRKGGCIRRRK